MKYYQLCMLWLAVIIAVKPVQKQLSLKPTMYLKCFGSSLIPMYAFKAQVQNAESYLCQVFKKQTALTDINKLRSWLYHHTKHTTLHSLPHSKGALLAHIFKSFYISYQICSIIDEVEANLDPTDFECIMEDDLLLPSNKNRSTSREHVCNCQHCATKRCNCRKLSISCSKFCRNRRACWMQKSIHIVLVTLKGIRNAVVKITAALAHIVK